MQIRFSTVMLKRSLIRDLGQVVLSTLKKIKNAQKTHLASSGFHLPLNQKVTKDEILILLFEERSFKSCKSLTIWNNFYSLIILWHLEKNFKLLCFQPEVFVTFASPEAVLKYLWEKAFEQETCIIWMYSKNIWFKFVAWNQECCFGLLIIL